MCFCFSTDSEELHELPHTLVCFHPFLNNTTKLNTLVFAVCVSIVNCTIITIHKIIYLPHHTSKILHTMPRSY